MPITVGGTTITFNDGSTQSTAAGAPTTTQVLNATAGASVGAVGTYAMCYYNGVTLPLSAGSTTAGSNLRFSGASVSSDSRYFSGTPSGTWRIMGYANADPGSCSIYYAKTSVWLRIS